MQSHDTPRSGISISPAVFWLATLLGHNIAVGQSPPEPMKIGSIVVSGNIRTRLEGWQWFKGEGDTSYAYSGTLARLSFSRSTHKVDWQLELAAPILLGLPANASGPGAQGQFGLGAAYYAANGAKSNTIFAFPEQGFVRFKSLFGRQTDNLRIGRFQFADGAEVSPQDTTLAALKSARINQRLIGTFAFTHVQRGFYGAQFQRDVGTLTVTAVAAFPTRGVFQVDSWGVMKTAFAYAAVTRQVARAKQSAEWRLFGIYYDDWRAVLKADNRPLAVRQGDLGSIGIATVGGHVLHTVRTSVGTTDLVGWGALQAGRWGSQAQRAASFDVEAGYQPKILRRVGPWIRAGCTSGSGDGDRTDGTHGTFFQMLPTPRLFTLFPISNMMNNRDAFAILILRPSPRLTIKHESHWLRLASSNDLWYAGGGAFQPWTFGFSGRPSGGSTALANVYDINADYVLNPHTTATAYWGFAAGKAVIGDVYPQGRNGSFGFLELNVRF